MDYVHVAEKDCQNDTYIMFNLGVWYGVENQSLIAIK
jgi:hypothetical protein